MLKNKLTKPKRKMRKAKPHTSVNKFEKIKEVLDAHDPVRACYVCGREGRSLQMIAPSKFRDAECFPGSPNWLDYWERLHPSQKTDAGNILHDYKRKAKL